MSIDPEEVIPTWLNNTQILNGVKWIVGHGALPADCMIVGDSPGRDDVRYGKVFTGDGGTHMFKTARECGFDTSKAYLTNAVKYQPKGNKKVNAHDLKVCGPILQEEILRCKPKVIITMGAKAFNAVVGKGYEFSQYRGTELMHPLHEGVRVFPLYSPNYVVRNPDADRLFRQDWKQITATHTGKTLEPDVTEYVVIKTVKDLRWFKDWLLKTYPNPILAVDCEWHGITWMHKDRYIRTVQLGYEIGKSVVIEFDDTFIPHMDESGKLTGITRVPVMDDHDEAWSILRELLENSQVGLLGHNIIADGEWLMSYGIDIRDRVVYDTMLAEYLLNDQGPWNLNECTVKYTNMGRYDMGLVRWKEMNKDLWRHGYGAVPRENLIPYSAKDVDAVLRIAAKQAPLMAEFMEPRGVNGEIPSLWDITLQTQRVLYEIEITGMEIDADRLKEIEIAYLAKLADLETRLVQMVEQIGIDNFNHRSQPQVSKLLFDTLGLQPVKTTSNRPWSWVLQQAPELQATCNPSTDKTTLEILEESHPVVKLIMHVRRVDTIRKMFLTTKDDKDQSDTGGGIGSKIWPDASTFLAAKRYWTIPHQ